VLKSGRKNDRAAWVRSGSDGANGQMKREEGRRRAQAGERLAHRNSSTKTPEMAMSIRQASKSVVTADERRYFPERSSLRGCGDR